MPKVTWSEPASEALVELYEYIAQDRPVAAERLLASIIAAGDELAIHPRIGRIVPERRTPDFRERIVSGYRIQYWIKGEDVSIVAVVHGRRLFRAELDVD